MFKEPYSVTPGNQVLHINKYKNVSRYEVSGGKTC